MHHDPLRLTGCSVEVFGGPQPAVLMVPSMHGTIAACMNRIQIWGIIAAK